MAAKRKIDVEELRRLWADPDMTQVAIAAHFGCTRNAVEQQAKRLDLPPRGPAPLKIDMAEFRHMWADPDMTQVAIAAHFGCTPQTIAARAKAAGFAARPKRKSGSGRQAQHRPAAGFGRLRAVPPVPVRSAVAEPATLARDAFLVGRLVATKGRYAALAEIAAEEGWTMAEAQRRWHMARCA